jgi:hypothetical protein
VPVAPGGLLKFARLPPQPPRIEVTDTNNASLVTARFNDIVKLHSWEPCLSRLAWVTSLVLLALAVAWFAAR